MHCSCATWLGTSDNKGMCGAGDLALCTPYAAQAKLIRKLIDKEGLSELAGSKLVPFTLFKVTSGRAFVLERPGRDVPCGRFRSVLAEGVPPADVGARFDATSPSAGLRTT